MRNILRQNKVILYRLKRSFGLEVEFYNPTSSDYDITTGAMTRVFENFTVKKAIVLPNQIQTKFSYDLAFIATNKNFTYGGYYDTSIRNMIVSKSDLEDNDLDTTWRCRFSGKDYEIKEIVEIEYQEAYSIVCQRTARMD